MYTGKRSALALTQGGVTLLELIVFILVISLALGALVASYRQAHTQSVEPLVRVRLLALAQGQLDQLLALPYDGATPAGGVPACGSVTPDGPAPACAGAGAISAFDGAQDTPYSGYVRRVSVVFAGADLGLVHTQAKRISVTVSAPNGEALTLSAYRANF